MRGEKSYLSFDWLTIFMYIALVFMGWMNIYSASLNDAAQGYFDFSQIYGKQMMWIVFSAILIIFILAIDAKFYERFASVIYLGSILSLVRSEERRVGKECRSWRWPVQLKQTKRTWRRPV